MGNKYESVTRTVKPLIEQVGKYGKEIKSVVGDLFKKATPYFEKWSGLRKE